MSRKVRNTGRRPERPLRDAFFAGDYDEVLRRSVDSAAFAFADDDTAFVVGALAFAGRIEEGRAALASWDRRDVPADSRTAARFFLGVACCRAGRYDEARALFGENLKLARNGGGPIARFYVHQGFGCLRYFTGRIGKASRHALRALQCAYAARFQYGRFLATDLRGHALVQTGSVRAGLALLEQARGIAAALDLAGNAGALACTMALYSAHFGTKPITESITELEALAAAAPVHDSYSRRAVQMELACQLALRGRSDSAWGLLEQLAAAPVPDGDRRARVRILLALAFVARLRFGSPSAGPYLVEARRVIDGVTDIALETEVLAAELLDGPADADRLERLAQLARLSEMARAKTTLDRHEGRGTTTATLGPDELCEDRGGALLLYAAQTPPDGAELLTRAGYLGLVPGALGLSPGRRLIVTSPSCVLLEEHGNVRPLDDASDGTLRLVRALASGARHEKADLLRLVWNLGSYNPERHDAVIHTAVSRLRAALGTARHWVEAQGGCYSFAPGVELVELALGAIHREHAGDATGNDDELHDADSRHEARHESMMVPAPEVARSEAQVRAQAAELIAALARSAMSTAEIARALGVSEMTAFRRLRALLEDGIVVRSGRGRSTRYTLATRNESENGSC
jgi:DNA-binding transcriptional ArsR family regulator/tetratricopeptide (TPR) repeat protein